MGGGRRLMLTLHRRRQFVIVVLLLLVLVLLLSLALLPDSSCEIALPAVASHRGFDMDSLLSMPRVSSMSALLHAGVRSFDVDLFWTADATAGFFVGHPPSLTSTLGLTQPLSLISSSELKRRALERTGELLPLSSLLDLLKRSASDIDLVSLELKNPEQVEWPRRLLQLYEQIGHSGMAHKLALVALSAEQADKHATAQASAQVSVGLHRLLRDLDAPLKRDDGSPRADLSALFKETSALSEQYTGWSVSAKLADQELMAAARASRMPVYVWVVDDEASLRRTWRLGATALITNRPAWAFQTLHAWHAEACSPSTMPTRT